jgi:hypothetical protein
MHAYQDPENILNRAICNFVAMKSCLDTQGEDSFTLKHSESSSGAGLAEPP